MTKKLLLLIACVFLSKSVIAQEMYLSISGKNSSVNSGDTRHQYDIWLKPEQASQNGNIQIFDAGYGGAVDFITENGVTTSTTFSLYRFDDLYSYTNGVASPKSGAATPISTLTAKDEERFKTRWVSLNDNPISGGGNGYVIRVTTDDGDDVNGYNVRVAGNGGNVLSGSSWKVITMDLSVALFQSGSSKQFQIKPYNARLPIASILTTAGEEDSKVTKIDAFGSQYPVGESIIGLDTRLGIANNWGLNISGSEDWLNTITVYGEGAPVLWEFAPIVIDPLSQPELSVSEMPSRKCTEQSFELSANTIPLTTLSEAVWIFNEASVGNGASPTIEFPERGTNSVRILIPNKNSYFPAYWVYTKEVFINTPPIAKLSVPKEIISPGEQIILSAEESYDLEGRPLNFTWLINGVQRGGSGPNYTFSNTVSGVYTVSVQVNDGGAAPNCSNAQQLSRIRINTSPYAEIQLPAVIGTGEEVFASIQNASDSDNDSLTFSWEGVGLTDNGTNNSVVLAQPTPGVYEVSLIVDDGTGATNSRYVTKATYEVNAAPLAQFNLPEKAAPGDLMQLDASASSDPNGDRLTYSWLVNGVEVATTPIATYTFTQPGDFSVTLKVTDQKGVSNSTTELSKSIHLNAAPVPVIDAISLSSLAKIDFSATNSTDAESELGSYTWDFGDGNRTTGPQASHTFQQAGSYTVKLTVDDGEGLSNSVRTVEKVVAVNSYPIASFTIPEIVAPGQLFTADASTSGDAEGSISSYEWFLDNNPIEGDVRATFAIEEPGTHTLTLKVKDDSGFEEAQGILTRTVKVNLPPVVRWYTEPNVIEPNTEIKFMAGDSFDPDGEIEKYEWEFSDGTIIRGKTIQRFFTEGGPKRFKLTVTDKAGLTNSSTVVEGEVSVNHQPYIVTESQIRSNSLRVKLDASQSYDLNGDPVSFRWTLPDGSTRNDASFTWTAPEAGIHIISLSIDDGLGLSNSINTEAIQVLINRPVKAVVEPVIASCTGQTVLFNSSQSYDPDGDPYKVKWFFGDGNSSEAPNPSYSYSAPGTYEATLMLHDGFSGDTTFTKIPVIVEGSPIAKMLVSESTVSVNSRLTFDGRQSSDPSGNLPSFNWDLGDGTTKTGGLIDHVYTQPGEYTVTLTVEGSGSGRCSNISQISSVVTVVAGPVGEFTIPEWTIPGETITLDGSASNPNGGNFKTAQWTITASGFSDAATGLTTTYTFANPGEYVVTLNLETDIETAFNSVSVSKTIKVNAPPVIVWNMPENAVLGSDIRLDGSNSNDPDGYISTYSWYLDGELISNNASEVVKLSSPGFHTARLVITDNSEAANKTVVKENRFFVNSSPEPVIIAPPTVYQNQTVTLTTTSVVDNDGDALTSIWKVDNAIVTVPTINAQENRTYRVVLMQDDGRGLANSVDSTVLEINPVTYPDITPTYPARIVVGGRLSLNELKAGNNVAFLNGSVFDNSWTATTLGTNSFVLAWKPDNAVLHQQSFNITVEDILKFTEAPGNTSITWNPANPKTILTAPAVNRSGADVLYTWKQNGEIIGYGRLIEVPINQGTNSFTIEVSDQNVASSAPIQAVINVIAQ